MENWWKLQKKNLSEDILLPKNYEWKPQLDKRDLLLLREHVMSCHTSVICYNCLFSRKILENLSSSQPISAFRKWNVKRHYEKLSHRSTVAESLLSCFGISSTQMDRRRVYMCSAFGWVYISDSFGERITVRSANERRERDIQTFTCKISESQNLWLKMHS